MWEAGSSKFRAETLGRCYHNNQVIKVHISQWCHVPPDMWRRVLHPWYSSKTQPNLEYVNSTPPNFLRSKPRKEASQEETKETWQLNVNSCLDGWKLGKYRIRHSSLVPQLWHVWSVPWSCYMRAFTEMERDLGTGLSWQFSCKSKLTPKESKP